MKKIGCVEIDGSFVASSTLSSVMMRQVVAAAHTNDVLRAVWPQESSRGVCWRLRFCRGRGFDLAITTRSPPLPNPPTLATPSWSCRDPSRQGRNADNSTSKAQAHRVEAATERRGGGATINLTTPRIYTPLAKDIMRSISR
jgi:hypothetical protein